MPGFVVHPEQDDLLASCPCCAPAQTRGFVYEGEEARAVYFLEFVGFAGFPLVHLGVAFGDWREGSDRADRVCFAFSCRPAAEGVRLEPAEPNADAFPDLERLGAPIAAAVLSSSQELERYRSAAQAIVDQDWRLAGFAHASEAPARPKFSAEPG